MNNRTLVILTSLVILGMIVLLGLNMKSVLTGEPEGETYLKYNQVRGMAVTYHKLPYTLNFKEQNQAIDMINRSVRVVGVKPGKRQKPEIDNIIIYQFDGKPDLILYPVAYIDKNLVFSVPQWDTKDYFMELSEGDLHHLITQTYDP